MITHQHTSQPTPWAACATDAAEDAIGEAEHLEQHFKDMIDLPGNGGEFATAGATDVATALMYLRRAQSVIPRVVDSIEDGSL